MSDVQTGAMNNAQAVIEAALVEAKEELAMAEHDREEFLANARETAEYCGQLRKAIAAYHKALGRNADGTPRKSRRKEVTAEPDRASTCTGAVDANSEDDGNQ